MKKIITIICVIVTVTFTAKAQQEQSAKQSSGKTKKEVSKMAKEQEEHDLWLAAGLTEIEIAKVRAINEEYAGKEAAVKKDNQLSDEDKSAKRKALSVERRDKITSLITEEKYKNWYKLKKQADVNKKESSN